MNLKILALLIVTLLFLAGCNKTISEVSNEEYLGKTVSVKGTASNSLKLGTLLGYTLTDKNGDSIIVASDDLPGEGKTVTAKGEIKKGIFGIGYYIDSD